MAKLLTFSLAKRGYPKHRPKTGKPGTVVPFPGVRYERLDQMSRTAAMEIGAQSAVSPAGKARYKPDF